MNQYLPLFDRVLLKPEPVAELMKGNIIIPTSVLESEPIAFGNIVSVGEKVEVVKVGDRVLYPKGGGTEIRINDEEHRLLIERDILMID